MMKWYKLIFTFLIADAAFVTIMVVKFGFLAGFQYEMVVYKVAYYTLAIGVAVILFEIYKHFWIR